MDQSHRAYLASLVGTEITTYAKPEHALPRQTWVITEHFDEYAQPLFQEDVDRGIGAPYTCAKFLCYRKDDPTQKPAFLRIHHQIPIVGTEYSNSTIRARQADSSHSPRELMVFIKLKEKSCQVTPALLGYERRKQEPGDIVPGGYSICIVWDKVPGESLTPEYFWSLSRAARDTIRHEFRRVYEEFLPCGIRPRIATLSNLIYDEVSGSIHISGFCRAAYVNPDTEWTDDFYVAYRLANPPQPIPGSRDRTEWEL